LQPRRGGIAGVPTAGLAPRTTIGNLAAKCESNVAVAGQLELYESCVRQHLRGNAGRASNRWLRQRSRAGADREAIWRRRQAEYADVGRYAFKRMLQRRR
jgi:hypothetical protein